MSAYTKYREYIGSLTKEEQFLIKSDSLEFAVTAELVSRMQNPLELLAKKRIAACLAAAMDAQEASWARDEK